MSKVDNINRALENLGYQDKIKLSPLEKFLVRIGLIEGPLVLTHPLRAFCVYACYWFLVFPLAFSFIMFLVTPIVGLQSNPVSILNLVGQIEGIMLIMFLGSVSWAFFMIAINWRVRRVKGLEIKA